MEALKQQKKSKGRKIESSIEDGIPDAPTLEEFEYLCVGSPTSLKVEDIESLENALRSAALDTELYKQHMEEPTDENVECSQTDNVQDEVDGKVKDMLTSVIDVEECIEVDVVNTSSIKVTDDQKVIEQFDTDITNENVVSNLSEVAVHKEEYQPMLHKSYIKNQKDVIAKKVEEMPIRTKEIIPFTECQLASLYNNQQLTMVDMFISEFTEIQIASVGIRQQHKLHELLLNYLRVRSHLIMNSHELESLKKSCRDIQKQLWCLDKAHITERGECQDGNPVVATHEYCCAHFNQSALEMLSSKLSSIKNILHNTQALYCYEAEILKLQIEYYIQRVCMSCKEFTNLSQNAPVSLLPVHEPSQMIPQLVEVRMCITILFNFQRKVLRDGKFVTDTREWLTRLVAILLRVASWQDHLFLLNHILRCPGGVTSWARSFVQTPIPQQQNKLGISPFDDPYLDHIITTLAVIVLPIKDRDKFLEQVQKSLQDTPCNLGDTVWVMLDEEGEEDEDIANAGANLFESDLMSLLNQIPFSKVFQHALCIQYENNSYNQNKSYVTYHHLFRMFAFFTTVVKLLKQGLQTYDCPRYRQLAKRLCALIRDIIQYVNDQWEEYDKSQITDETLLLKLQLEFECFFLRAVLYVFSSRRMGAWQYLASIPYYLISPSILWQIFYILHTDRSQVDVQVSNRRPNDWINELNSLELRKKFEERLAVLPGDESYFLLTTFANMAMARTAKDYDFIQTTTFELLQIGFLSEKTQDCCSKDTRSMLTDLTDKYPALISDILHKLKDNFASAGKLSLYLFAELKLHKWIPQEGDMIILSSWMHQHPLSSTESQLARSILSRLNWGQDESGNLYLPIELHRRTALLIVELAMKYIPDGSAQTASMITESVKQVSSMIRPQSVENLFSIWVWEMISKLKLHLLDQTEAFSRYVLQNLAAAFAHLPDMDSDPRLEVLAIGIKEKQPIACYVAMLMTSLGHSVPLICARGFNQLEVLQYHCKYEEVLICLHYIIPLFLDCIESLNEKFINLIVSLTMADRSYMKAAKRLRVPEFPGAVLKQFSNMIQSHLYNFRRYGLESPKDFVCLWLRTFTLVPGWNKDQSVMYLMDTVVSAAFFYSDAKLAVERIFQNLFSLATEENNENMCNRNVMSTFGSFLNWATGASNSNSLLDKSIQSVWVAYQVLLTEQYNREIKSGLWQEILKELSQQPKMSLDTAIKRACATVKMQPFGSNSLFIYRWSQQALDAPMDHPILPLLWQNFFALFLARSPSASGVIDPGGIGEKFFEGMANISYIKKLKKRLQDTSAYLEFKSEKDEEAITDDRRIFCFSLAKFYKTLSLWLEEPRLHRPTFYLPTLPPQYMPQKLLLLVENDRTPWLEYIDYWTVQQNQIAAVKEWEEKCNRAQCQNQTEVNFSHSVPEDTKPLQRIYKRLTTYEDPVFPPPINRNQTMFNSMYKENMYNSNSVITLVKPHLKVITNYAQTYNLMVSEHTAVDSTFLELIPTLYKETVNYITLHALCDPAPSNTKQSRSGTPPIVHCAGPAIITIKVPEAQLNNDIDYMINQNRAQYDNLLVKASQLPPSKVTQGCVFIDHLITMLEHEMTLSRTNRNTLASHEVQESGASLFYYLLDGYSEDMSFYPPTKQLITTCLERLGQLFINGEERQAPQLLKIIMQKPNLGGLLGPYFTAVVGGASTFLQMYQTVVEFSTGSNIDLCFVLLSKFDVGLWLNDKRPRLSERSTFIDLIFKALCMLGVNPEEEKLVLHGLFRNHVRLILLHDFPEHYGEILNVILRCSESQSISLDVWQDLFAVLSGKSTNATLSHSPKTRNDIRHYATEQKLLSRREIYDTAVLLSRYFMQERLQYGLYGLYPKYRTYNEPLSTFLGMVGHALVILTLQSERGVLGDELCEKMWPVLCEMYAPWVKPYWTRNLKEPTAAWIQQLTDDRSVLLPWIIADGPYANKIVTMFIECVRFIIDMLPASNKILSFVWQFYVENFAHDSIKDHVLSVIHGTLLTLPWDRFYPSINDVELMVKVTDQYLPDSHLFLGSVFTNVHWSLWINDLLATHPMVIAGRMHVCLLNLLVKLSNEPNVKQNEKVLQLLMDAEKFCWHLLDPAAFDHVINWHVLSCDPRVVLHTDNNPCHPLDTAVHKLLKVAAGYDSTVNHFHPSTLKKRQLYIRATVKMLIACVTKYKTLLSKQPKSFKNTLLKMLDEMEAVILNTVAESQQVAEASLLITELLYTLNQSEFLMEHLRTSWTTWLLKRTVSNPILISVLKVIGTVVSSPSILGELIEAALEGYFTFSASEEISPTWASALIISHAVVPCQPPLETVLISEGKFLALYFLLLKRLPFCQDIKEEGVFLINLIDWISAIRPVNTNEEKLPLLWAKTFELAYRQCLYNENTKIAARAVKGLALALFTIADDGGQGWGILSAIGLRKSSHVSVRCKFLCRAMGVYCLAQLPESKSGQQLVRYTPNSPGVASSRTEISDTTDARPSADAIKAMQVLEGLLINRQYVELKADIERSIKLIKDPGNSLHNATVIVGLLTSELYSQRYLHVLMDD